MTDHASFWLGLPEGCTPSAFSSLASDFDCLFLASIFLYPLFSHLFSMTKYATLAWV
jgi:hypothetical protein